MAFSAKNVISNLIKTDETKSAELHLTKGEIETLLTMVKEAHFKGEHVQKVYDLILKLQKSYSQLP